MLNTESSERLQGKTTICKLLAGDRSAAPAATSYTYDPTLGFEIATVPVALFKQDRPVILELWDVPYYDLQQATPGQLHVLFSDVHAVFVVFDALDGCSSASARDAAARRKEFASKRGMTGLFGALPLLGGGDSLGDVDGPRSGELPRSDPLESLRAVDACRDLVEVNLVRAELAALEAAATGAGGAMHHTGQYPVYLLAHKVDELADALAASYAAAAAAATTAGKGGAGSNANAGSDGGVELRAGRPGGDWRRPQFAKLVGRNVSRGRESRDGGDSTVSALDDALPRSSFAGGASVSSTAGAGRKGGDRELRPGGGAGAPLLARQSSGSMLPRMPLPGMPRYAFGLDSADFESYAAHAGYRGWWWTSAVGAGALSLQAVLAATVDDCLEYWGYVAGNERSPALQPVPPTMQGAPWLLTALVDDAAAPADGTASATGAGAIDLTASVYPPGSSELTAEAVGANASVDTDSDGDTDIVHGEERVLY